MGLKDIKQDTKDKIRVTCHTLYPTPSLQHTQHSHAVYADGHRTEKERFKVLRVVLGWVFLGVRLVQCLCVDVCSFLLVTRRFWIDSMPVCSGSVPVSCIAVQRRGVGVVRAQG